MTFREELMDKYTQEQVAGLKADFQRAASHRYLRIQLSRVDVEGHFFSRKLVGHGKMIWDQIVQLDFQPRFEWNGGFPYLWIEW